MKAVILYIEDLITMPIVIYKAATVHVWELKFYVQGHEALAPKWRLKHPTYLLLKWILKLRTNG